MDARVTVNCLAAWLTWFAAFGLVLGDIAWRFPEGCAQLGLCLSAAAATLHVRQMLGTFTDRERNAFDLGREAGRGELRALR